MLSYLLDGEFLILKNIEIFEILDQGKYLLESDVDFEKLLDSF